MCKVYNRLYACGHTKPDYRFCTQASRWRIFNVFACPRQVPGISGVHPYECNDCMDRGIELQLQKPAPLPPPIVRSATPASSRGASPEEHLSIFGVAETLSRALGGYEENVPAPDRPCAPWWEARRSTLEDLDQEIILAKLRPDTAAGRKGKRGDAARGRDQRPSEGEPEPAGEIPQRKKLRRKKLRQSKRSADLRAEAAKGSSDKPTSALRNESQREVAEEPSRPRTDREILPSYEFAWNYGVRPSGADKRREEQVSNGEHRTAETQASSHQAPATRESRGDTQQQAPCNNTPHLAYLEPLGAYDPAVMPAPLRTSRRRKRRQGKELQKMDAIPEVNSPASTHGRVPSLRSGDRPPDDAAMASVREAVAVRPGAAQLMARRVEVTGPQALRATREVLVRA